MSVKFLVHIHLSDITSETILVFFICFDFIIFSLLHNMASSVNGKGEPNPVLRLATGAVQMAPSCPLGLTRCPPQEKSALFPYNVLFMGQAYSVKMARNWPLFCVFMELDFVSLNIQPSRHLLNNPYLKPRAKIRANILRWPQLVVWLSFPVSGFTLDPSSI